MIAYPLGARMLTVTAALGWLASFILTVEKFKILSDYSYVPSCSINPILACGSVMDTWQASAFGFPNSLIGVAAFTVLLTLGILGWAGVALPDFVWRGVQIGSALGVLFVHWLIAQSLFLIRSLCPYCMVVWVVTMAVFVCVTLPKQFRTLAMTAWSVLLLGLIGGLFWDYWSTLI